MNYLNTFIEVAGDYPVHTASVPAPKGGKKTIPVLQYEMIAPLPSRTAPAFALSIKGSEKNCVRKRWCFHFSGPTSGDPS